MSALLGHLRAAQAQSLAADTMAKHATDDRKRQTWTEIAEFHRLAAINMMLTIQAEAEQKGMHDV